MAARDDLVLTRDDDTAFAAEFFPILEQVHGVAHHPAGGQPRKMRARDIHNAGEGGDQNEAADTIRMLRKNRLGDRGAEALASDNDAISIPARRNEVRSLRSKRSQTGNFRFLK